MSSAGEVAEVLEKHGRLSDLGQYLQVWKLLEESTPDERRDLYQESSELQDFVRSLPLELRWDLYDPELLYDPVSGIGIEGIRVYPAIDIEGFSVKPVGRGPYTMVEKRDRDMFRDLQLGRVDHKQQLAEKYSIDISQVRVRLNRVSRRTGIPLRKVPRRSPR